MSDDPTEISPEEERVRRWEFDQLVRLGFDKLDANYLVEARVSWHEAWRLIRLGCPRDRVPEILL